MNIKAVILSRGTIPWFTEKGLESQLELKLLNRSFFGCQVDALKAVGINEVCALTAKPNCSLPKISGVCYKEQETPLGTAGSLSEIRDWLADSLVLVCYGSTFIDKACLKSFLENGFDDADAWAGTVAVMRQHEENTRYETVEISENGCLKSIYRIHRSVERRNAQTLAGLYLLHPKALDYIPQSKYFDLKEQLFPLLLSGGYHIKTHTTQCSFPVLTPADYLRLQFDLLHHDSGRGLLEGIISHNETCYIDERAYINGRVLFGTNCRIAAEANIVGPILIGDDCIIESGANVIGPAVIGKNCRIGKKAVVKYSVVSDNAILGDASHTSFSVLGPSYVVGSFTDRHFIDTSSPAARTIHSLPFDGHQRRRLSRIEPLSKRLKRIGYQFLKRSFDITLSLTLMTLSFPLWLAIAILIRIDSPGPILFSQRRCGRFGKEFAMLKFRTMVHNAHQLQDQLRSKNEVDGPVFKLSNDPRITKVGAVLRKTSLDELPQLLNVLRGDMSFVGPRPLVMKEMSLNPHWRDVRLSVKPGITGLWQVECRSKPDFYNWVQKDIEYVRQRSLAFDLKVLIRTLLVVLKGT